MARAQTSTIPGITFVKQLEGISEYTLDSNGMRILLIPDTSVPVVGCMVTYHVGSRNEAVGYTGATHLLEHLMFKGSKKFNPKKGKSMDVLLESRGARINATTWLDRTNYYELIPKDVLPLALEIEADRMRNATFNEEDRQSEMPVVRNEYERGENDSSQALDKELWALAFLAHPYHHPTIGWKSDIEGISIERLYQFYNDFYWPNNATLTIVGSYDHIETLTHIQKVFGVHARSPHPIPSMHSEEPIQEGQRRAIIRRAGNPLMGISHKIPSATHEDMPALIMLASILYEDKASRLYKTFIDTAFATDVTVFCGQFHDASLFQTFITLTPAISHEKAEKMVVEEYEKIMQKGVTLAELKAAKRSARVWLARRSDGPYALLSSLNEDLAVGDWTRFVTLPKAIEAVTTKDIQRVAKKYFVNNQSVVGYVVPII
ncbi:pitrilysin family protein [soil metagenome]